MGDALAPWHIIILLVVLVVLFGSRRLPGAAKSLGESMHIFKRSVAGLSEDGQPSAASPLGTAVPAAPPIASLDTTSQQLADLQRQVADLQRQNAAAGQVPEAQSSQPL